MRETALFDLEARFTAKTAMVTRIESAMAGMRPWTGEQRQPMSLPVSGWRWSKGVPIADPTFEDDRANGRRTPP